MALLLRCLMEVRSRDGSLDDPDARACLPAIGEPARAPGSDGDRDAMAVGGGAASDHGARVEPMENLS
jgi:hypothetical protein